MKISDAAQQAGVTPATWKYYIREGLVPEGERLGANRTDYTEEHVRRVRLVRALLGTGKLSVLAAREVLGAVDAHTGFQPAFEAAQLALGGGEPPASEASRARIEALIRAAGWVTAGHNPGVDAAARALDGFAQAGADPSDAYLAAYAQAAQLLAAADLATIAELSARAGTDSVVEVMVVGTVMGDALVSGLRRVAQEHESAALATDDSSPASADRPAHSKDTP